MSDSADDLILQMQHLAAQAKAQRVVQGLTQNLDRLKSATQRVAWEAQKEVTAAEARRADGERKLEQAKAPNLKPLDAAELLQEGRAMVEETGHTLIKARARLNFALDRMSELDRREYEAFQADVRAATHGHLANED